MFLAFDVHEVLKVYLLILKVNDCWCHNLALTAIVPVFFGKSFLYQSEAYIHFPLLGELHVTTITLFELGILLTVVGVM